MNHVLVRLVGEECCTCGITFGVTENHQKRLRDSHKRFYCPVGHVQYYQGQSETEKLKADLEQAKRREDRSNVRETRIRDQLGATERSNTALRGVVTRKKNQLNRVKHGVCPCCNRNFKDLKRHMDNKHPSFQESGGA